MADNDDDFVFLHINGPENVQPSIVAANVITLIGAIGTIVLRFFSRRISKTKYWWDDWLVFPALFFALMYFGDLCFSLSYGFGKDIGDVSFARLRSAFLGIFVGELAYAYSIAFTKFSILALYGRVFDQRWARIYCYTVGAINALWMLACTILACLQCQPTRGFWDRNIGAKCDLDVQKTFLALGVTTILTDVALVALPTYICWKLSLSNTKKMLLCGVFVTGLFVTVASGVRLKAILDLDTSISFHGLNITYNFSDTALWSGVEANMAIVSSCLPVLRPLIAKVIPTKIVPTSLRKPSNPMSSYGLASTGRKPSTGAFVRMEDYSQKRSVGISPDIEAQNGPGVQQGGAQQERPLMIVSGPQRLSIERPSRPPTPPEKDTPVTLQATMTRPPSWNMEVAFAEGQRVRVEKGGSDSLRAPSRSSRRGL